MKELQTKLNESDEQLSKDGKRLTEKLEHKIHELEMELDAEQRRHRDTLKEMRKCERRAKETSCQYEQDKHSQTHLHEVIEQLQQKLRLYRKQAEEAEEMAAMNLGKYRHVQYELEDVSERADQAENEIAKVRARRRRSISFIRESTPNLDYINS